jgi:hypothetical protein
MKLLHLAIGFLFALTCERTNAQSSCHLIYVSNQQPPSAEECTARINTTLVIANPPDSMKMSLWSWAASLSLIFTAEGHPISQDQIIRQNFSDSEDIQTSNFLQFAGRLNRDYTDANGKKFTCMSMQIFSTEDIVRSLSESFPVLLYNFNHHAVVQTSISYYHFFSGGYRMTSGIFWDPVPGFGYGYSGGSSNLYARSSDSDFYFSNNILGAWSVITR